MRGCETGAEVREEDRDISGGTGTLAQADTQKRSAKHTRKRMNTFSHPFRTCHLEALKRAYERFPEIGGRSIP